MGLNYSQSAFEDERSIILIGETGAGKSAFGNFLLKSDCFKTGDGMLSTTQSIEQRSKYYTEDNLKINLHVFDMPGLNDPRKIDTTYLNNTYSALKKCANFMSTLFVIVINISDTDGLNSAVGEIHKFLDKVKLPDFNLTDNAMLVFSHADKLAAIDEEVNNSLLHTIESFPLLQKLLSLVLFRKVLVDSPRYLTDEVYWRGKMKEVLLFTRPKIRVLMLGPHLSAQTDMLQLLRKRKSELVGETEELPGDRELEIKEVSLEVEGSCLIFEKSFDFTSLEDLNEQDESVEKSNALNQIKSLVTSITEIHTFTAFCVVIKMSRLRSSFIQGIKAFASAISEDKPDLFYSRCFFLFTHCNKEDPHTQCGLVFKKLHDLREMGEKMENRVTIANTHPDTHPDLVSELLKKVVNYSYAMKQKCYGQDFVTSILSIGFDLPPGDKVGDSFLYKYCPPNLTQNLFTLAVYAGILGVALARTSVTSSFSARKASLLLRRELHACRAVCMHKSLNSNHYMLLLLEPLSSMNSLNI